MIRLHIKTKWWAMCLLALVTLAAPLLPFAEPSASAFTKGLGLGLIHVKLSPDNSNVTVTATRQKHYMDGTPDSFVLKRSGTEYSSPSSDKDAIKVPITCDSTDNVLMGSFDVTVTQSNGGTAINGTSNIIGQSDQSKPIRLCGGDEKTITVNISAPSSSGSPSQNSASICGTLTYTDPSDGQQKPWQSNSTLKLTGTKSQTGHTDSNGHYCFINLPKGTYKIDGSYVYVDGNGISGQATFSKSNISLINGQNYTADYNSATPDSSSGKTPSAGSSGTATCENTAGILGWIVCAVIDSVAKGIDGIYNHLIKPLLETKPISIAANTVDPVTHHNTNPNLVAWSSFRIIADVFLVIALLVIVFGQSLGGGMIDSYSAKKILPRLLAAAILINISFYIVAFAVDIANIIGGGVQSLIMSPFHNSGEGIKIGYGGGTLGVAALIGTGFALKLAIASFTDWIWTFLLVVLLPILLLLLAILSVLIFRQALILLLVIISPVAFALYCLPNTEQYFKKWWDLLFKALLVYPIIALLFGMGNIFSIVVTQADGPGGPFKELLGFIALFVPLFLIPFAFKLAGGVLGRMHDILATGGKRGVEAVKGNPNDQNSLRNRLRRDTLAKFNERDLSARALGTRLNPTTAFGSRRELRKARLGAIRNMNHGVFGKLGTSNAMFEYNSQDSNVTGDLAKYASGEQSRAAARADYNAAQADINSRYSPGSAEHARAMSMARGTYEQRLFSSAAADKIGRTADMRRRALLNPATIGYEIDDGEVGWDQATGIMRDIAGNDEGMYRSMVNEFQYIAKSSAGRTDLAGATDGNPYSHKTAWNSQSLYQIGSGKPRAVRASGKAFLQDMQSASGHIATTPINSPEYKIMEQSLVDGLTFYKEQETLSKSATGAVRDEAVRQMQAFEDSGIIDQVKGRQSVSRPGETIESLAKKSARAYDREEALRQSQESK